MRTQTWAIVAFLAIFHLVFFNYFFASLMPGTLGFMTLVLSFNLFLTAFFWQGGKTKKEGMFFGFVSVVLTLLSLFRAFPGFSVFFLGAGAIGFTYLSLYSYLRLNSGIADTFEVILSPLVTAFTFLKASLSKNNLPKSSWRRYLTKASPWLMGLALATPFLLILLPLLGSADPIFRENVNAAFGWVKNFDGFIKRILVTVVWLVLLVPLAKMSIDKIFKPRFVLSNQDQGQELKINLVLVLSVGLFLGWFLFIQFKYLFVTVAETELAKFGVKTYSEYVSKGFFELVFTALIVYAVITLGLVLFQQVKGGKALWLKRLNLILAGELGLLIISVGRRLYLYQQYHGLTVARVYGSIFLFWISGMILILVGKFLKTKRWVVYEIGLTVLLLLGVGVLNIDHLIAANYPPRVNGEVDFVYLAELSGDGFLGWTKAYDWAREQEKILSQKEIITPEDNRQLMYARQITSQLTSSYYLLLTHANKVSRPQWRQLNISSVQTLKKMVEELPITELETLGINLTKIESRVSEETRQNTHLDRAPGRI